MLKNKWINNFVFLPFLCDSNKKAQKNTNLIFLQKWFVFLIEGHIFTYVKHFVKKNPNLKVAKNKKLKLSNSPQRLNKNLQFLYSEVSWCLWLRSERFQVNWLLGIWKASTTTKTNCISLRKMESSGKMIPQLPFKENRTFYFILFLKKPTYIFSKQLQLTVSTPDKRNEYVYPKQTVFFSWKLAYVLSISKLQWK